MGNMIGILSTVILVSTLATLIFAVGAYIIARRRREVAAEMDMEEPGEAPSEPRVNLEPIDTPRPAQPREEADEPAEVPPWRGARPAPDRPPVKEPGADGPLFRKLTLPGVSAKSPSRNTDEPREEREQPNWE